MRTRPIPLFLSAVALSVMIGVALSGAPVASATPGQVPGHRPAWRIVKVFRSCGIGDSMQSVTAVSADDAWAVGQPNWAGAPCWVEVEHWNGSSWRRIPVPRDTDLGVLNLSPPVTATSSTDAWIFPAVTAGNGLSIYQYNEALRWNGSRWLRSRFPVHLNVNSAVAVGRSQVWAFGDYYGRHNNTIPYTARYSGRSWQRMNLPGDPVATNGTARAGVWAFGPTLRTAGRPVNKQVLLLMHWTGRSWARLRLPRIKAPKADDALGSAHVAVAGRSNVWIAYQAGDRRTEAPLVLLHWDDRRWHRIAVPRAADRLDWLTPDGRGGIWLLADLLNPNYNPNLGQAWFDYDAGSWTSQSVPSPRGYSSYIFGMAWIPGTTSALAVAEADSNTRTVGVVYRYPR